MKPPSGSRSFSTFARRQQSELQGQAPDAHDPTAAVVANMISQVNTHAEELHGGLKFQAPGPLPKTENYRTRYDTVVDQFTKLIMQDGKLGTAQRVGESRTPGVLPSFVWTVADDDIVCRTEHGVYSQPSAHRLSAAIQQ